MNYNSEMIQKVWSKGDVIRINDPIVWRKDQCGAWIHRMQHGNRDSPYGWEIDHINPKGGDELSNLRPLQWKNNVATGEGRLKCPVTAKNSENIEQKNSTN